MEQKAMSKQHTGSLRGLKLALLAVGSSLVLAGCAGNPPTEQFAVTESAVNNAVSAGGPEYAPVEMKSAQDKLSQARIAMNDKEYDQAKRLAQQAGVGRPGRRAQDPGRQGAESREGCPAGRHGTA